MGGIRWTTVSTIIVSGIQLLQLSILARYLSPSDFGLMALVMVVIGFSQAFLDMGISNAIIHRQDMTNDQLSSLYWLNVFAGVLLFSIIFAVSPLLSLFFKEPRLTKLLFILGLTFIIQPFGQQYMVLWQKEMRFAEMAKIDVLSKFMSLFVSAGCGYLGLGVYALVYGALAAIIMQTLLFITVGMKEHRPQMVFHWVEIKEVVCFGVYQMGERIINYFNSQLDVILIGKLLGAESLGVYNVAKQLIMRPAQIINPIITKVTFPAMARVQHDPEMLRRIYLKTICYLSSVNFPIYAMTFALAPEVVKLMFGDKWMAAAPIVQILSIYGALRSTGNPVGSLLLAKGKAKLGFYWNFGLLFYVPMGILFGSQNGLTGVSWMLVIMFATLILPNWYFLVRPLCGAKLEEYMWQILLPLILSLVAVFSVNFCFLNLLTGGGRLIWCLLLGTLFYFILSYLFNQFWFQAIRELLKLNKYYRFLNDN